MAALGITPRPLDMTTPLVVEETPEENTPHIK
jgi:hypothetical protein